MMRRPTPALWALLALFALTSSTYADPAIGPAASPGVITAWQKDGPAVALTVDGDFDASEVAAAIRAKVADAKVRLENGKVLVEGMEEAALLEALQNVNIEPVATDDVDAMLSALQNPGGEDDGSGSSIRAGKTTTLSAAVPGRGYRIEGKVTKVRHRDYPVVVVHVEVASAEGAQAPSKGTVLKVLPYVRMKSGVVAASSRSNLGAWYAREGDRVVLQLERAPRRGFWIAKGFERR